MGLGNVKAIIFDLDNTLLDRGTTFRRFIDSVVLQYFSHVNNPADMIERIIELDQDGYKDKQELFTELLEELPWQTKPGIAELLDYYAEHYVKSACLMEGAEEVIRQLGENYKIGLITNGKTHIQYGKIDQLDMRDWFDVILVSEEAGVKKPHAGIFEMAVAQLGISADECLYIGDHPVNDIQGAGGYGMQTIWFEVNQPWHENLTVVPKHKITHLRDLIEIC
ncbi:HAD family hydrolase [Paenibacillus sp. JCM 10914]|uniref:HAD family hydrolase n=1 Tax=Paenibacillus sp. JCM 10914 TaxID=1236974 RepID=UPI0003CC2A7A|nr:HAD family hydrolase [Paenibacillus sp. JCM 10914]GAE06821.1 2-haloalkanoic acid dehalogenase [Paenibacillus sp. JCM 10914]